DHELVLEFEYCTALFRKETIARMSTHYLNILEEVTANPRVRLSDINILTAEERRRAAPPVQRAAEAERVHSVLELFLAQVRTNPDAGAVAFGAEGLSYGELNRRANQLAARIREQGIGRGDLVGVAAAPSIEMIIAVLGVLKLGAAYLPIDPTTPVERLQSIVADSGLAVLLMRSESEPVALPGLTTIVLDNESRGGGEDLPELPRVDAEDLAYVIYTSGST